jgi:hypothetical protein
MRSSRLLVTAFLALSGAAGCSAGALPPGSEDALDRGDAVSLKGAPSLLGINIDPMNPFASPSAAEVAEVGAAQLRIELKVPTRLDLSPDDELAAALAEYDVIVDRYAPVAGVLLLLDYQTLSRDRYGDWTSDAFRDEFVRRAGLVADHYKNSKVSAFEIWNEEDLCAGDYCPELPVDTFAWILAGSAKAIHDAHPGARVAMGGMGSGKWESYVSDVIATLGPAWDEVDAVGLHPYTFWPKKVAPEGANILEYQLGRVSSIANKPLWLTEWGDGGSQYEMMQAVFTFFAEQESPEASLVEAAYLYAWSDTQHGDGTAFGLFDHNGNKKDAEWGLFHDVALGGASEEQPEPGGGGEASCGDIASSNGWEGGLCGSDACHGQGQGSSDCDVCCAGTSRLHGTIAASGAGIAGLQVSAWGHEKQDLHVTYTDDAGIYVFEGLNLRSRYNLAVNAAFDPEQGQFVTIDPAHEQAVRDNVSLISGPDGWHGEDFGIAY